MKNNIPEKLIEALGFNIQDLHNYYVNFKGDNEIIINVYPKIQNWIELINSKGGKIKNAKGSRLGWFKEFVKVMGKPEE